MSVNRRLWAAGLAGIAFGVLVAVLLVTRPFSPDDRGNAFVALIVGWSFLGIGLSAWRSRPDNRVGPLMVAVGFAWMATMLIHCDVPLAFSVGVLVSAAPFVLVVHLLLAYPSGRLWDRSSRAIIAAAYVVVVVGSTLVSLLTEHPAHTDRRGHNLFAVADAPGAANAVQAASTIAGFVLVAAAGLLLLRRWRAASALQRRALGPVLGTGGALVLTLAITLASDQLGGPPWLTGIAGAFALLAVFATPYAYMAGLLGFGWSRGRAVGALVGHLNRPEERSTLRDAVAQALGDPELEVVFKRRDRDEWVDGEGRRFTLPPGRALTEIRRDGETTGGLVHAIALHDDPELLRAVGNAAALALDNLRLEAELRARVSELQESRANIIAFGLAERRRLERDLHDGAQQRLVALSLQVNLARAKLQDDPATAAMLLDSAREELRQALDELRELARGIHPAILTDQGLGPAVTVLAQRSPVPVDVETLPATRLPAQVEAVAYFVVSEALANVAKYAHATHATVSVGRADGHAVVEVRDDGIGGADARRGTGLRGLADRVAALDGRLRIQSPDGVGTVVRAELPCASS
jgi:signal transduction histidine kinase